MRTTAAALLVVAAALLVAASVVVGLLERSLTTSTADGAAIRAEAVADELDTGIAPDELMLGVLANDEEFVQILTRNGDVVASSFNVAGRSRIADVEPGERRSIDPMSPPDVEPFDDPFILVASEMSVPPHHTVVVGRNLEPIEEASRRLRIILSVAMPLLLAVVGFVVWVVVSRALSPVEAIRAEVDSISGRELHRRVPDPGGDDEIARLAATMNRMLERLDAARRRERRFVSDASHELRSPVAAIRQYAEVARTHPEDTSLSELADVVLEEDVRLQRLVEDLLLLDRIDEGTLEIPTIPVDLDDLVLEEATRLRGTSQLRVDSSHVSSGRVIGDRQQLERLVRNLTENAARHARTQVRLSLGEQDGHVLFAVEDDGAGIDALERDRIFDRFVRLDEGRDRDSGGSGLGLAIVREVAEFHGGSVSVIDGTLGGTRIEVLLPIPAD
ncbi:MAG TPA: HAMP domain-containing sensor histidine kinase [Actinomycetota bacterium]|nr:HAMP domain-containing sensor histidine kinase [Actinomycetota bacterium]